MTEEDDPFADLDRDLGDDVEPADDSPELNQQTDRDTGEKLVSDTSVNTDTDAAGADTSLSGPAFSFDETKQRAFYARPATWEKFEDALDFEVQRELRDRGIRDVPKRELHDAALRVLSDRPRLVADAVEQARQE